jgi:hypothetical protein
MRPHVTVLDSKRHDAFLREQRKDPVTKEPFKAGDRVVICAGCRSAFLEASWLFRGQKHCGQSETLEGVEVDDAGRRFSRRAAEAEEHSASDTSPLPEEQSADVPSAPASVRLRDIPVRLADIPTQLSPIIKLREM